MRQSLSWRGRRVQLLRDITTIAGATFRKGEEGAVLTTYLGLTIVMDDGRRLARVAKHQVALLNEESQEAA